jgi:purine-binding chemotaxis protein CheW
MHIHASMAQPPRSSLGSAEGQTSQYLTFSLGSEVFGTSILGVKEIIEYREPAPVPMMPSGLRGVINLRGAVVPVVDLLVRLGGPASAITRRSCIVIVAIEHDDQTQTMGVQVDAVHEVMELDAAEIDEPPPFGTQVRSDFIKGIGKTASGFVILLDMHRILELHSWGDGAADLADTH